MNIQLDAFYSNLQIFRISLHLRITRQLVSSQICVVRTVTKIIFQWEIFWCLLNSTRTIELTIIQVSTEIIKANVTLILI